MNKRFKLRAAVVAALLASATGSAMAEFPLVVHDILNTFVNDGVLLASAFLVVSVAIGAIKVLKKGSN